MEIKVIEGTGDKCEKERKMCKMGHTTQHDRFCIENVGTKYLLQNGEKGDNKESDGYCK